MNFANKLGLNYIESSAKNGTNILLIFDVISKKMIKVFKEEEKTNDESIRVVKQSLSLNNELFLQKQKKLIQNIKEQEQKKTSCCWKMNDLWKKSLKEEMQYIIILI